MGCATSKNEDKCNRDVCERRKILTGFHMSRNADGIETNFQFAIAIERKAKKTYEGLAIKKPVEDPEEEYFFPIPRI